MADVRRCSPPRSSRWFFLVLLLLEVAVTYAAAARTGEEFLGKFCPSLDACRGGVANMRCCTAINNAINKGECPCVCKQLKIYNHGHLAQDCNDKWCLKCRLCRCANTEDGPHSY